MRDLTPEDVENLKKYQHRGCDLSFISNKVLDPYWWTPVAKLIPNTVSPNAVTLSGGVFVIAGFLVEYLLSPNLNRETQIPGWAHIVAAACFFMFQTADACDGKHARRTKMCSPLGDLLDHGVDTLVYLLGSAAIAACMHLGMSVGSYSLAMSALVCEYWCQIECLYSGIIYLGVINGPTEGVLFALMLVLSTAPLGSKFWTKDFMHFHFSRGTFCTVTSAVLQLYVIYDGCMRIVKLMKEQKRPLHELLVANIVPTVLLLIGYVWIALWSDVMTAHPLACLMALCIPVVHIINEMIVGRLCKREIHRYFWYLIYPVVITGFTAIRGPALLKATVAPYAIVVALYCVYCYFKICLQAAKLLGLPLVGTFAPKAA